MTTAFKMAALDMDGTLLMSDKRIHPDTPADIAAVSGRGVEVVYCTGRAIPEILPYVDILPFIRFAVCLSGAFVFDLQKQRSIAGSMIGPDLVQQVVEEGERHGAMVHFLTRDQSIVRADLIDRMPEFHMGVFQPLYRRAATGVEDMRKEAVRQGSVPKINIYFRTREDRQHAYEALRGLPLTFSFMEETMLEMTAGGTTKDAGLRALAKYLGISMNEVLAIGDSANDRTVLETVGFSVAMGNAAAEIKDLCDAVTDDNDHNGVGKALRSYCF